MNPLLPVCLEGLGHEEALVRNTCLSLIRDLPNLEPGVTRRALDAIERHGAEAFEHPHELVALPIDADKALYIRRHIDGYDWAADWQDVYHFIRWLIKGPDLPELIDWLKAASANRKRRETGLLRMSTLLRSARMRHAVEQMDMDAAFTRTYACFEELEGTSDYRRDLWEEAEYLCQRMLVLEGRTRLRSLVEEWLDFDEDADYLPSGPSVYMGVYLAGHCGMVDYLPQLLALFQLDEEDLNEYIQDALVCLASPSMLRELRLDFNRLSWVGQLYASSVYERHPYPEFAPFFTDQLANPDPDDPVQLSFAVALASCGTEDGRVAAQAMYDLYPDHPEMQLIGETLYAQYRLRGIDHPAMESMRARLVELDERARKTNKALQALSTPPDPSSPFQASPFFPSLKLPGRNDPCPCGSGKKFKKCCLKQSS